MLITNPLSMKMPLSEALAVSLIGIVTVILILAIIAVLILLVSKTIRAIEAKTATSKTEPVTSASAAPVTEGISAGQVDLVNTDEKEAAVIMAIVSKQSGIPLERLSFKSIKLIDDEKKGDENK